MMEVASIGGNKTLNFRFRDSPYLVTLPPGKFKFEAWGAAGNENKCSYSPDYIIGRGGYTKGVINFKKAQVIYVYVGEKGNYRTVFNSHYESGNDGGGATDFRLVNAGKEWYNFESLKSRIMVAGGGGGADCYKGGDAGGLTGSNGIGSDWWGNVATGGNQTSGGQPGISINSDYHNITRVPFPGRFGISGSGKCIENGNPNITCNSAGSGGGGYYGGGGNSGDGGGGGGSSYISGHEGCISILPNATDEIELQPSNDSFHYSNLYFTDTVLLGGNESIPLFNYTEGSMIGNEGEGFARITYLSTYTKSDYVQNFQHVLIFSFVISLIKPSKF